MSIVSINGIALFLQFIGDIFLITTVSIIIDILLSFLFIIALSHLVNDQMFHPYLAWLDISVLIGTFAIVTR